jgi:hypothetical protein
VSVTDGARARAKQAGLALLGRADGPRSWAELASARGRARAARVRCRPGRERGREEKQPAMEILFFSFFKNVK